jgi:hypothetical protein
MPEPVERKLAAILSADVVGYSRLMAEDEAGTIRTLTVYREEIGLLVPFFSILQLGYQMRRYLFEYGVDFDKAFSHGSQRRLYLVLR